MFSFGGLAGIFVPSLLISLRLFFEKGKIPKQDERMLVWFRRGLLRADPQFNLQNMRKRGTAGMGELGY